MNRAEADVSDLWIQHQRRIAKTRKTWSCIYCPGRKIPLSESNLWMHAEKCHQDNVPVDSEELKRFRQPSESNSALKRLNKAFEDATPRHRGPQSLSRVQSLGLGYDESNAMTDDKVMAGDRSRKRVAVGHGISASLRSPFCEYSGRVHNAKQRQHSESPRERPQSQPETRPISQEQLVAEVKGIYAGLVMVEAKCIEVDNEQATLVQGDPPTQPRLNNEQWQALIALHRTLLHEHHDFFLASQHPSASPALRRLASKYAMPARMWRHGIHSFLELLRHRLPMSLDYMLSFIYIAYSVIATLYECKQSEDWVCSTGIEEESHELSPNLKERKEHIPSRARDIPHNKISGHNPSSARNIPMDKPTEHRDNVVHDNKLEMPSSRARSEELSPRGPPLTLGFLSKFLAALSHKKQLFASLLIANIITVTSGRVIPPENSETTTSLASFNDSKQFQSLLDKIVRLLNLSSEAVVALIVVAVCETIRRIF